MDITSEKKDNKRKGNTSGKVQKDWVEKCRKSDEVDQTSRDTKKKRSGLVALPTGKTTVTGTVENGRNAKLPNRLGTRLSCTTKDNITNMDSSANFNTTQMEVSEIDQMEMDTDSEIEEMLNSYEEREDDSELSAESDTTNVKGKWKKKTLAEVANKISRNRKVVKSKQYEEEYAAKSKQVAAQKWILLLTRKKSQQKISSV